MWGRRKQRQHRLDRPGSSKESGSVCSKFTIAEIRSATQDFDKRLLIGSGGSGNVYKGTIKNGTGIVVAVKRWKWNSISQGAREFEAEVGSLPMLRHPNIVDLIGYCTDGKEKILVNEYVSNGSLAEHLHKHQTPLSWSQRLKICIDAARALNYIHDATTGLGVIHGNVKSSNIMLDNQWIAKITDFNIFKIISMDNPYSHVHVVTYTSGTLAFIDPESFTPGKLSKKFDVYSFGVVLLEVLCRRHAMNMNLDVEQGLLTIWAQDCLRTGKLEQILDPDLRGQISLKCLNDYARIVKCCLHEYQEPHITMAEVLFGLESILALHERTDNLTPQMGITTSDWRLQKYFSSFGENSGGSYFWKDLKLLSVTSQLPKGDHGDQTESLYELMRLEYIQRADVLMRMKDFLHLIWFYPVKRESEINFGFLLDRFSSLNEYIRKSLDSSWAGNNLMEIQALLQDNEEHLDDVAFDMVAYLPESVLQNRSRSEEFKDFLTGIPEIHASAVASATHRAVSCIKDLKVKKLGISGRGAEEVTKRLNGIPELKRAFDVVLCVQVKRYSITQLLMDIKEEMRLWRKRSSENDDKRNDLDHFHNCLLFLDCNDDFIDLHEPEFFLPEWFGNVHIVMTSRSQNVYCPVLMGIRVEDHLLPWILFSTNADLASVDTYSSIQKMATRLIEKCHGHLLAIILLARALIGVVDVSVWELALQELASQEKPSSSSQLGVTNDVMVRVLRFIWSRMEALSQRCIIQFASSCTRAEFDKSSLINNWIKDGLVKTEQEGENVFKDLIRSFLLERIGENSIRMRDEIQVILLAHFSPRAYGLYLIEDGSKSNRMPNIEEWDAREIHLTNNRISELPDNPHCPFLVNLFLHFNRDLMDIPITFFNDMPSLQVLDLSSTSLKCLPSSISKLTTLRKLFIRDCDLLMEQPPEIGDLKNLKVFDSEGTQLVCLPEQFGLLTKLECLKFSLYNFEDEHKRSNPSMKIIPSIVLSKLIQLKELIIFVDLHGDWWEDEVKLIINILPKFRNLESLRLYFPTMELLAIFMETQSWRRVHIYQHLLDFGFIVGHLQQRGISRVPLELHKTFVKLPKCLTYTNGEGDIDVITMALTHANALFLDRHWTIRSLSAFGLAEMEKLKFCLLSECNEMLDIANGNHLEDSSLTPVLGSLEYLSIHYMKSLGCIWNGPIHNRCLSNIKTLAIHSCPELKTIFTQGLLFNCLEYLIVEDCTTIKSLMCLRSNPSTSTPFLPSLRKIALVHLPQLVSISRGISIAPRLVRLVVYDCPNLDELSYMEASGDLREIKGENEWWDALKWCEPEWTSGQPDYLARVFTPLGTNGDIMDEVADAVNLLPHLND